MSVVVLHTGEGRTIEGIVATLQRNGSQSNEVYDPATDRTVSLIPAGTASKSLRNLSGGVETNRRESDGRPGADVYQIELVGFAAEVAGYSDQWHRNLARHVAQVCYLTGTPLEFPCTFEAYPPRDGIRLDGREPWRLTHEQWLTVNGVVGHQHVPENVHGDPGDISRTVAYATATQEGDDMELTDRLLVNGQPTGHSVNDTLSWTHQQADKLVAALLNADGTLKPLPVAAPALDVAALADAIAERIVVPVNVGGITVPQVKQAVVDALASVRFTPA